jgi:hypothetical protein
MCVRNFDIKLDYVWNVVKFYPVNLPHRRKIQIHILYSILNEVY